jgi:hypothetical protein
LDSERDDQHDSCDGDLIVNEFGVFGACAHPLFYDVASLALVYESLYDWIRDACHLHSGFGKC